MRKSIKVFLKLVYLGLCCVALAFGAMAVSSFTSCTSIGIDTDRLDGGEAVLYTYYRVRWQGDGSLRFGYGGHHYRIGEKRLEPFDLGGRFFQPPQRETPRSIWNQIGFWRSASQSDDQWSLRDKSITKPWQIWFGVPSLLPALVFGALVLVLRKRLRHDMPTATSAPSSPPQS